MYVKFNALDVVACLALAARIHGTDKAVRKTAFNLLKRASDSADRDALLRIINTKQAVVLVERILDKVV